MARDVFQHHDGIVHDESGRNRQRHQRQIVEAVADQVHGGERRDQRDRHRHHRNEGRPPVAQKGEHHEGHQHDRDDQGAFDIAQRRADRGRAVDRQIQVNGGRHRRPQLRHQRLDAIHDADDVGPGLPGQDHQDRRLAVGKAEIAQVLDGIRHLADIGQAHWRAIAVGDDQRSVLRRLVGLVVGVDLIALRPDVDTTFRTVRVGAGERGADVFQTDAIFVQRLGDQLDPHRRQRAAADGDIADTLHPVSYTHLDVYKRQAPGCSPP